MACYQCTRPAMYLVTEDNIPLCLDCYAKFSQIIQVELEQHERWMNYLHDQADAIVGLPQTGFRFPPRPKPVIIDGVKMNNITVSNSVVGTINTGSVGIIDQSISAVIQNGDNSLADAIKNLSEAIIQSKDITQNQKSELIEILSVVSTEAASPPEQRKNVVAQTLIEKASSITMLANDIADACQKWWPILLLAFQSVG